LCSPVIFSHIFHYKNHKSRGGEERGGDGRCMNSDGHLTKLPIRENYSKILAVRVFPGKQAHDLVYKRLGQ
jgi:hypothetical protein